jgi:peroxiredoxin
MTSKQQWLVVLGIVAVLAGGAFAASYFLKDELTSVSVGSEAPGFAAKTLTATPAMKTLTDYRGDVVLLNIWATWCIPCRTEMPSIEAVHQTLGPKGLKVVAISIDDEGAEQKIRDFAKEFTLSFEMLHDPAGTIQGIYRTTGVPETFVIGRDGVIRKKWIGAEDWNSDGNQRLLSSLLAEPKSGQSGGVAERRAGAVGAGTGGGAVAVHSRRPCLTFSLTSRLASRRAACSASRRRATKHRRPSYTAPQRTCVSNRS